ncbi:MAG: DUF2797 domain-containing protein, partial [Flavobacteriales bacterium]|nr:DUF2797 domain-containing protein [Flavobacteriales bacterium]
MNFSGNIRKMKSSLKDEVQYVLPLYNNLNKNHFVPMNQFIGSTITISFSGLINCVETGRRINKTYGEGMCYDAWKNSPNAVESIIRPELSRIHEGIALRDEKWEIENHLQPHYVYLAKTGGVKVGVTRATNLPYRWIDQGAVEGLVIAETPYRQAAGLIEIALKNHISDKTNWRKMLTNDLVDDFLEDVRDSLIDKIPEDLRRFIVNKTKLDIPFPVIEYPQKVKSIKLDKIPNFEMKLMGIKGQYLIFEEGNVINLRSHSGFHIEL